MKYIILILVIFCVNTHAQDRINKLYVGCDAGKGTIGYSFNPKIDKTIVDTVNRAVADFATRDCNGTWIGSDVRRQRVSSSSSSSAKSSASSSSVSSARMATLSVTSPTTRANGQSMPLDQACGFMLKRPSGVEEFPVTGIVTTHKISPPLPEEVLLIAAYDCKGLYSDFVEVAQ